MACRAKKGRPGTQAREGKGKPGTPGRPGKAGQGEASQAWQVRVGRPGRSGSPGKPARRPGWSHAGGRRGQGGQAGGDSSRRMCLTGRRRPECRRRRGPRRGPLPLSRGGPLRLGNPRDRRSLKPHRGRSANHDASGWFPCQGVGLQAGSSPLSHGYGEDLDPSISTMEYLGNNSSRIGHTGLFKLLGGDPRAASWPTLQLGCFVSQLRFVPSLLPVTSPAESSVRHSVRHRPGTLRDHRLDFTTGRTEKSSMASARMTFTVEKHHICEELFELFELIL